MKRTLALLLFAGCAAVASDDSDLGIYNEKLGKSARQVLLEYKVCQRYADPKFTTDGRLAEINNRVGDDDVSKDEMVALRAEQWALNNADFNVNVAKTQFRDRLTRTLAAYKELRDQSKSDPALTVSKENELAVKKADAVAQTPDAANLDVSLPTDKPKAAPPPSTPEVAKTPAAPAPDAKAPETVSNPPADASGNFDAVVLGKVRTITLRRDAPSGDTRLWMVIVDVKDTLRGKSPGSVISVHIHSPTQEFGEYSSIDELRGRRCVWSLKIANGVVTDASSAFPGQRFEDADVEKLRGK